jgi:hypothetical protein
LPQFLKATASPTFLLFGKHDVFADKGPNYKKKREALHHLEKLKVLDKLDTGMSIAVVRHHWCKQINDSLHQEK